MSTLALWMQFKRCIDRGDGEPNADAAAPSPPSSSNNQALPWWGILLIVLGGLLLVALACSVFFFAKPLQSLRMRRKGEGFFGANERPAMPGTHADGRGAMHHADGPNSKDLEADVRAPGHDAHPDTTFVLTKEKYTVHQDCLYSRKPLNEHIVA